jgi:hypothetical protein
MSSKRARRSCKSKYPFADVILTRWLPFFAVEIRKPKAETRPAALARQRGEKKAETRRPKKTEARAKR